MEVREIWNGYTENERAEIFEELGWGEPPPFDSAMRPAFPDIAQVKDGLILDTSISELLWDSGIKKNEAREMFYRTKQGRIFSRTIYPYGDEFLNLMGPGKAYWMEKEGVPMGKIKSWLNLEDG